MNAISNEIASKEIEGWLDLKRIRPKKRESNADQINAMIEAVEDGILSVDQDTGVITHSLLHPIGDGGSITSITYKPRIMIGDVHKHLKKLEVGDIDGRLVAYVAALSDKPKSLIQGLDTDDYSVAQHVAVFFL